MNWFGLIQKAWSCSTLQEIEARCRQLEFKKKTEVENGEYSFASPISRIYYLYIIYYQN